MASGNTIPSRHKYHTLDGIRGVAALFVLTRHAGFLFGPFEFPHSYLAVDVFFALSGFVLAAAYDDKLRDGRLSGWEFMNIRFVRLWPLFALASLVAFMLSIAHWAGHGRGDWSLAQMVATFGLSLIMLPSPFAPRTLRGALFPLNGPSWSLLMEILVNAAYAAFHTRLSSKFLLLVMLASGTALVGCAMHFHGLDAGASWGDVYAGLPRVTYAFSAGMLVYRSNLGEKLIHRRFSSAGSVIALGIVALILGAKPNPAISGYYDVFVALAAVPILVLFGSSIEPGNVLARFFALLGLCSYGIYILQVPISGLVLRAYRALGIGETLGAPITGFGFVLLLLVVTFALDRYFDQPMRQFLRNILGRQPDFRTIELSPKKG